MIVEQTSSLSEEMTKLDPNLVLERNHIMGGGTERFFRFGCAESLTKKQVDELLVAALSKLGLRGEPFRYGLRIFNGDVLVGLITVTNETKLKNGANHGLRLTISDPDSEEKGVATAN